MEALTQIDRRVRLPKYNLKHSQIILKTMLKKLILKDQLIEKLLSIQLVL